MYADVSTNAAAHLSELLAEFVETRFRCSASSSFLSDWLSWLGLRIRLACLTRLALVGRRRIGHIRLWLASFIELR